MPRHLRKGHAHAGAGAQEGQRQQQVDGQQVRRLARVPEDFQRIERHALRQHEAADGADPERSGGRAEQRRKALLHGAPVPSVSKAPLAP